LRLANCDASTCWKNCTARLIPREVEDEINIGALERLEHARALTKMIRKSKLRVLDVSGESLSFEFPIDAGEAESIARAMQEKADLILIDDLEGREEAKRLGLKIRGTVGIVMDAFEKGILSEREAKSLFERAHKRRDIWVREEIIQAAIESLGKRKK
jgi:predicted nucleic acid-binding protein